jgi:hypothetical protein
MCSSNLAAAIRIAAKRRRSGNVRGPSGNLRRADRMPTPSPRKDANKMKLVKYDKNRTCAGIHLMHTSSTYNPRKLVKKS